MAAVLPDSPPTLAEQVEYLREILKLKLWFAATWLAEHPEETLPQVLRGRVDLLRKSVWWSSGRKPGWDDFEFPEWLALEHAAAAAYAAEPSPAGFEARAWPLFWPVIEPRAESFWQALLHPEPSPWGSLRYDPPGAAQPQRVAFHIHNALLPRSIFADPAHLPGCLRRLMQSAAAEHGASELLTGTWLNSHPRFLALFPAEYQANLEPPHLAPRVGFGFWGQFVNRRGGFNAKHGRIWRQTGRPPYDFRVGWCSFAALREHLDRLDAS